MCAPDVITGGLTRYQAAQALKQLHEYVPEWFHASPIWPAVVALASGDLLADCDGQVFRRAAHELSAQGHAEAAFNCLLWSASCSYANSGITDAETLRAAVQVARAARWKPLHRNLLAMTALRDPAEEARTVQELDALAGELLTDDDSSP